MPLNYNEVQRIYRTEKNTPALQHVGENFYRELQEFLSQLEEEHKSYMNKLIQEIIERRRNKVLMQTMRTDESPPVNATPEETRLYNEMIELLGRYRENLSRVSVREEAVKEETKESTEREDGKEIIEREDGKVKVRILQPLPAIIGADSKHYGPFEEGEEIEIPRETAEILIGKGMVEEVS